MSKLTSLLRWKWTPRYLAVPTAALGVFGLVTYSFSLASRSELVPAVTSIYFVFASILMIAAGVKLWRSSSRGWWLAWLAMLVVSASGVLPFDAQPQTPQFSRIFQAGFMVVAGGIFFSGLSHPGVYRACFAQAPPPHPLLVGTPLLLILLGAGVAALDPFGWFVGPFVLVALLISGNAIWMAKPLVAAFKRSDGWHAG
jgi:hypothetical protein